MNTAVIDDDEELLLLRIKALKSTPRVNISVQFTSDSDNDAAAKDIKKKKQQHGKRTKRSGDKAKLCLPSSSCNIDNDVKEDDDETMLREIALNSLRRRSTEQSPNVVVLQSGSDNQTTIQISQNVGQCTTDSISLQQVIISGAVVTASSLLGSSAIQHHLISESSAIQHDLISSTSEDHGTGKKGDQSSSSVIETTCSSSVIDTKLTVSHNSTIERLYESRNSGVDSNSDVDFKAEIVQIPALIGCNRIYRQVDVNSGNIIGNDVKTIENSSNKHKNEILCSKEESDEEVVDEDVLNVKSLHNKAALIINSENLLNSPSQDDDVSSGSDIDTEISNLTQVDIVIQRKFPSLALKDKIIQSELGKYSPSSPSETDEDEDEDDCSSHDLINSQSESNTIYHDDVLSLCASDKEGSELDSFSLGFGTRTKAKTPTKTVKLCELRNALMATSPSSIPIENTTMDHKTISELSTPNSPDNSDQKEREISDTYLPDKDVNSHDASGLNIILDRYLNEVAANRKMFEKKKNLYNDDENDDVGSSHIIADSDKSLLTINKDTNWIDCKPGPSGYTKTIIPGYCFDSDESTTGLNVVNNNGTLSTTEASSGEKKSCDSSNEDIKNSLGEQNVQDDGKRDDLKDVTCSICLGPFENRSFLNSCFHSFCYMCIVQWSELSRLCPLCKTKYLSLIHSVNTDLDYETFEFPEILPEKEIMPVRREFSETMEDGRRFRYRSTVVDRDEWEARRLERERLEQEYIASRQQRRMKRRLKWSSSKSIRKTVYQKGLEIKEVKQRGVPKYRDITPKFFHDNPALKHRLVPWLLRDLNVLLGDGDDNIRFVMSLILTLISKLPMNEDAFKEQLRPFLFEQTDHFVAELVSFASSPYDMRGYDKYARYNKPANDVEITFSAHPAIHISDDDSPSEDKELDLLKEVLNIVDDGEAPLGGEIYGSISNETMKDSDGFESISPLDPLRNNGFEDITPVNRSPVNTQDEGNHKELENDNQNEAVSLENGGTAIPTAADAQGKDKSNDDSSSDDMCNQVRQKRHKENRKEKKKKRKRKHRRLDSDDDTHKKKKKNKKGSHKKSRKESDNEIPLSKDLSEDFVLKKGKHSECVNGDGDKNDDDNESDEKKTDHGASKDAGLTKKSNDKTKSNHKEQKDKRKRAEEKKRRRHKKKYKYVKLVKHKRKRLKSFSSESEDDDEKSPKTSANHEHPVKKKLSNEQTDSPRKKTRSRKNSTDDDEDEKPSKKSLKRKSTSLTDQERELKRKKKEKTKDKSSDVKTKHKKRDKKKKKKYKRRKSSDRKTVKNSSSAAATETCSDKKVDNELRSKIDHAINAIMDTKGGNNSSDDDEFLNSQEVQDLLCKYKYNDKLDLIKDGDAYKTRAEVVQELLLIEKAITRRKEKKKHKQISQSTKSVSSSGKNVSQKKDLTGKQNSQLLIDKAAKKAEREKSYKVLIKELQEIEGRINSCRSSLQVKPSDMI